MACLLLIHEADPQSRPVLSVRPSVPIFQNLTKQNNFQVRIVIATGWTVGLAEWIIDGTHVLFANLFASLRTACVRALKEKIAKWK